MRHYHLLQTHQWLHPCTHLSYSYSYDLSWHITVHAIMVTIWVILHVHHCLIEIPRYDSLNIQVLSNVFFLVDCKGANVLIVYEYSDRRKIIIENSLWYIFKMSFNCHKPYNLIYKYMHMVWEKNRLVVNVIKVMGKSNTWLYNFFQSWPNFFFKVDLNVLFRDNTWRTELLHVENTFLQFIL